MPFNPLAQIALSEDWQQTPFTDANYFRFVYRNNVGFSYLVVAQAQVGNDGLELFGSFRSAEPRYDLDQDHGARNRQYRAGIADPDHEIVGFEIAFRPQEHPDD